MIASSLVNADGEKATLLTYPQGVDNTTTIFQSLTRCHGHPTRVDTIDGHRLRFDTRDLGGRVLVSYLFLIIIVVENKRGIEVGPETRDVCARGERWNGDRGGPRRRKSLVTGGRVHGAMDTPFFRSREQQDLSHCVDVSGPACCVFKSRSRVDVSSPKQKPPLDCSSGGSPRRPKLAGQAAWRPSTLLRHRSQRLRARPCNRDRNRA